MNSKLIITGLFVFGLFSTLSLRAQQTYQITGIPAGYEAKIEITPGYEAEFFKPGTISIYHSDNDRELISVAVEEMVVETENGSKNISFDKQDLVYYEDVNFDGKADFAVLNGQMSCYHQPSYEIYLAAGNQFISNEAFSELAQNYCGMFRLIPEEKKLTTQAKSGCCWHEYREFVVENNRPVLVKLIEDDATIFPYAMTTTKTWDNGKMKQKEEKTINLDEEEQVISFKLAKNGKQVTLFIHQEEIINYVLTKPNGLVEFNYPAEAGMEDQLFTLKTQENRVTVTFQNGGATYEVYQARENRKITKVGVNVWVNGKKYHLPGDISSLSGNMEKIQEKTLTNLR